MLWAQLRSFRLALLAAFQILSSLPLAAAVFQRVLGIHKLTELALCSGILTVGIGRATGTKRVVLAVPHLGRADMGLAPSLSLRLLAALCTWDAPLNSAGPPREGCGCGRAGPG